jgi:hypothetical protein
MLSVDILTQAPGYQMLLVCELLVTFFIPVSNYAFTLMVMKFPIHKYCL